MDIAALPKIELHLHLDCSLSYKVVRQIDPSISIEDYTANFVGPPKCTDLADFLTRAINGVRLMQTLAQLRLVTLDLFEQLKADRVIYAEIRFAPHLHTEKGLKPEEVVSEVNEAVGEGIAQTGVEARLILCTLRHYTEAQSMEVVRLVEQFKETHVVGFDIAADEAGFPIDAHQKAFDYAHSKGLHVTAHAGEAKGAESVWETLEHFRPSRIGHGVRSVEDPLLLQHLRNAGIHLEVCPTSNVQTNIVRGIADHPADQIYRHGISMSINTDARTISDTTLTNEYSLLKQHFGWEKVQFLKCNLEAIDHAFIPRSLKMDLKKVMIDGFEQTV